MPFLIFGLTVIIISIFASYRNRHSRLQDEANQNFWDREAAANNVRRQDISGLSYITIPTEIFSIDSVSDNAVNDAITALSALQEKKILNLGGLSNTDLKMQYGPANLAILTEYDQNYTDMLLAISSLANRLIELDLTELAIPALEFAVSTGTDISIHYTILANYYKQHGKEEKITELKSQAEKLNSLMQQSILSKIDAIVSA